MKKLISFLLAAAFTCAAASPAANAADWVTVSSWAYNDVSNFTNAGLLPESFDEVSDYKASITRLQFAELTYSMLSKTGYITGDDSSYIIMTDTDSRAAAELSAANIIKGIDSQEWGTDTDENGEEYTFSKRAITFLPDALLTREEMAEIALRIIERYCPYLLKYDSGAEDIPADVSDISIWARKSVEKLMAAGIISGVGDGRFLPKAELSIEQAVSLIYRIYNALPAATAEDGADVLTDTETPIQTYSNGIIETKAGNVLYLKRGDDTLMSFETDIYSNIYCASYGGSTYAAAQTVKGATDVYDILSGELLCKIPYPTYELRDGIIIVKSRNVGPFMFGLYDYRGNELIEPKYSLSEIGEIIANGMTLPEDKRQDASGWIYYSNKSDGGKLYRIDSNGENREKLSEHSCQDIEYAGGWVFYRVCDDPDLTDDMLLYCMRTDGKNEQQLSEGTAMIHRGERHTIIPSIYNVFGWEYGYEGGEGYGRTVYSAYSPAKLCYDGEWIYYSEGTLHRARLKGEEIETENIGIYAENTQLKDKTLYFLNDYSLYRFDGDKPVKLSGDMTVVTYGFKDEKLQICAMEGSKTAVYTANEDGSGLMWDEDVESARETYAQTHETGVMTFTVNETHEITELSDEHYRIYYHVESAESGYDIRETLTARDADGNERGIGKDLGYPHYRIGDTLYFVNETNNAVKNRNEIRAYDLNTGEFRTIAEDIREVKYPENAGGSDWFTYLDYSFNIRRYNASTDSISEVFPCGSLHRYGAVQRMIGLGDGMYKIDTDGNYSLITNTDMAGDCIYAENGAETAVHF